MRAACRALTLVGLFVVFGTSLTAAQHPQTREGFWISFGLGYGSAHEHPCDRCADTTVGGLTAFLRLGGTLSRHLLIGGEVDVWGHDYSPGTETLGSLIAALYYYPKAVGGLFLKGGLGFATYRFSHQGAVTGAGPGFVAGLGYDIRVGRKFSITPLGDLWYGKVGDVKSGGALLGTGEHHTIVSFGLGATFH
jgi:hypothetical protein